MATARMPTFRSVLALDKAPFITNKEGYDDFAVKIANFASDKQSLSNTIFNLTDKIELFNRKIKTDKDLERPKQ